MVNERGHLTEVQAWFDERAQKWHDIYVKRGQMNNIILNERREAGVGFIAKNTRIGGRVLDAGCGTGLAALDLLSLGYTVHGVDVSTAMIAKAQQLFSQRNVDPACYKLESGDVGTLPLVAGSYDAILGLGFMQYQKDEARAVDRFNELLKPGGTLVLSGPMKTRLSNGFGLRKTRFYNALRRLRWGGAPPNGRSEAEELSKLSINSYNRSRFRRLLSASNFELLEAFNHGYASFVIVGRWLNFKREYALHRALTRLGRFVPIHRFANDIVVVARKKGNR